jgi:mono/diheme cytochrome c family protein
LSAHAEDTWRPRTLRAARAGVLLALGALVAAGCRQERMADHGRLKPYETSAFFPDGQSSRPLPAGAIPARGPHGSGSDGADRRSAAEGAPADRTAGGTALPGAAETSARPLALLRRGRERFDIFCSPCHGRTGDGQGMIVKRGFTPPPSLHLQRLRDAPDAHLLDVIATGYGSMPRYGYQIPAPDRHAIAAYIRALQLSQSASVADLSPGDRLRLEGAP